MSCRRDQRMRAQQVGAPKLVCSYQAVSSWSFDLADGSGGGPGSAARVGADGRRYM